MLTKLIQIFKTASLQHIDLDYALACAGKNYYTNDFFKKRLTLERRRSERFNTISSIIIFSLINRNGNSLKIWKQKTTSFLKIVCDKLRETDAVSAFNDDQIMVLLPDTKIDGAQLVVKYLFKAMVEAQAKASLDELFFSQDDLMIEILPFPGEYSEAKLSPIVPMGIVSSETLKKKTSNTSFQQIAVPLAPQFHSNLPRYCISCADGAEMVVKLESTLVFDRLEISKIMLVIQKAFKRMTDVVGAIFLLTVLLPVFAVVSALIKLSSPGPVLFKQKRVGLHGKEFNLLKFRSMYTNSNDNIHKEYVQKLINGKNNELNNGSQDAPVYKMQNDPRITPIGKFIRKTSIDEFPQLWNVLKGEMSLVGPRPPIPYEVEAYQKWHYRRIIEVKPGMTGLWQVKGRSNTTFDEMVRLDIQYIRNWSLYLDAKILFGTINVVLNPSGN